MSTPPREELARRLAAEAEAGDEDSMAPRDQEKTPQPDVDEGDDLKATLALSKDALAALLEKVRKAPAPASAPGPSGAVAKPTAPPDAELPPARAQNKRKP